MIKLPLMTCVNSQSSEPRGCSESLYFSYSSAFHVCILPLEMLKGLTHSLHTVKFE